MLRLWYVRLANAKHAAWDTSLFSTGISATNDGIVSVKCVLFIIFCIFSFIQIFPTSINATEDGIVSVNIYFIYIQIFLICKSATNDETLSVTK